MHYEGQILQNHHTFALFDPSHMGDLMIPESLQPVESTQLNPKVAVPRHCTKERGCSASGGVLVNLFSSASDDHETITSGKS